jgi:uncharacterized protein (TIGR03437 family)
MLAATPGLFVLDAVRPGQGVVLIANSGILAMPPTDGYSGRPAQRGEYISILANGLGEVQDGSPALVKNYVRVWIGGIAVQPTLSASLPGAGGIFQISVQIPQNIISGPSVPVYVEVDPGNGKVVSSNQVVIAVAPGSSSQNSLNTY